jgi:hypothetical protein
MGRLAAFGHSALEEVGVFENDALSQPVKAVLKRISPRHFKDVAAYIRFVEHNFDRLGERYLLLIYLDL